jgi:ATP-dependent DNA helicase RecQ
MIPSFTALVHVGVENASKKRLENNVSLEKALIDVMQELAPDLQKEGTSMLSLRRTTQHLKDNGYEQTLPGHVLKLLRGIASDGRSEDEGIGSIRLKKVDAESYYVTLQRDWESLKKTAELRRTAASLLLEHLISCVPPETRGIDLLATTTLGKLHAAVESDMELKDQIKDVARLTERALLWLHEQEIARLGRGLVVLRPAMNIRLAPGNRQFTQTDYAALQDHYSEQVIQIHVMAEYARQGLEDTRSAIQLTNDYFTLSRENFIGRWFPKAAKNLSIQTSNESFKAIVSGLNKVQREIVTDDREKTNVLVLAGPGSGKTRVLVHRIAYLVRVRRENPRGILALAYNRHAAAEIRRRLRELIDDDANGVTVLTCHALAMRLTGTSFAEGIAQEADFRKVLSDAVKLLRGEGMADDDADEQRDRLLAGFRWILVDEYQDIGAEQYELISALAGRTLNDPERKLSLFAVGDDDQNVYAFAGASVKFIRQFQADYKAKPVYLTENYRSTTNIIATANAVIATARERMKAAHPIEIDETRKKEPAGGMWKALDPMIKGRVHLLNVASSAAAQAEQVMGEMLRLASLEPDWDWSRAAVISRQWKYLHPVRAFCQLNGIPVQMADQEPPQFWRLRETQHLKGWLEVRKDQPVSGDELDAFIRAQSGGPWWELLQEAMEYYRLECGTTPLPAAHLMEWLAEWGREIRQRQRGLLLLTAHRTKGLEFDHVAVLNGAWEERESNEDPDATRRLYYVAMTRARKTLLLASSNGHSQLHGGIKGLPTVYAGNAPAPSPLAAALDRRYEILTPGDVDLSFAGRTLPRAPIHKAIQQLQPGDPLRFVQNKGQWLLQKDELPVGRLSKGYVPPAGMHCIEARVHAVLTRFRQDGDPAFNDSIQCDKWETVLPELVFAKPH